MAGVQRVLAIAKGLSEQGEKIKIVYLSPTYGNKCKDQIQNVSFEYWGDILSMSNRLLGMISSAWHLLFCLSKRDIIYYYGLTPSVIFLLLLHKRQYYHEFTEYPPFIFGGGWLGAIRKKLHIRFMKRCIRIFVISKKLRQYCINKGISPRKTVILNMLADDNRFKNVDYKPKERYIAYCGNGENFKDGVDILLKAFALVAIRYKNIKLYILGKGPKNDTDIQLHIIKDNNLEKRVFMPGIIASTEVPQFIINAEILVLARPFNIQAEYGFPTKLGEYLLTGNPVVVTKVGELDDFLTDKKNCLFAKPDDPEDFADKLLWLLNNRDEAHKIGERGKLVAQENFSYRTETKKIIEAINDKKQ